MQIDPKRYWFQSLVLFMVLILAGLVIQSLGAGDIVWSAYLAMCAFYAAVYAIAIGTLKGDKPDHLLANRSLPLGLAIFTMSATWVGGGFINGSAEYAYSSGLIWVQAPWGYALSLIVGGLLFARPMRNRGYTTLLDPLQEKFSRRTTVLYFVPALAGDVFWTAAILVALGTTFGTILDIEPTAAIIMSTLVVILYTSVGGLWSVAWTDVIQLVLLVVGLSLVLTSILHGDLSFADIYAKYAKQMGGAASFLPRASVLGSAQAQWWDGALLLIFGGIPWQVYFQRVLAARNAKTAMWLSILAGVVCLLVAMPAIAVGIIAAVTDWEGLGLPPPVDAAYVLPHAIRYLTNPWVMTIGLGAVAAAVMSSADSSILSAASVTMWNVIPRKGARSSGQQRTLMKKLIWIIGIATMLVSLQVRSIYELWFLCSDLVYCLLFPALVTALFDPLANRNGAVAGFAVALFLRLGGGEALLGIPAFLPYPTEGGLITIPFKTLSMLAGLGTIWGVSRLFPISNKTSEQ